MGTNAFQSKISLPCCVTIIKIFAYIQIRMPHSIFTIAPYLAYLTAVLALASLQWWGYPMRAKILNWEF
jgi:hypothetical protein